MRFLVITSTIALMTACASKNDAEVTMMRVRPIELAIEVRNATPSSDAVPNRFLIEVRVLKPESKQDVALHLLVDGVREDRRAFTRTSSRWTISCDEEAFEHEKRIGFSFWSYENLNPNVEPNKPVQETPAKAAAPDL